MEITDDMCRRAVAVLETKRVQGFSTPQNSERTKWGPPHYVRDVYLPPDKQEIWRGDSCDEMRERIEIEEMRLALVAALSESPLMEEQQK